MVTHHSSGGYNMVREVHVLGAVRSALSDLAGRSQEGALRSIDRRLREEIEGGANHPCELSAETVTPGSQQPPRPLYRGLAPCIFLTILPATKPPRIGCFNGNSDYFRQTCPGTSTTRGCFCYLSNQENRQKGP